LTVCKPVSFTRRTLHHGVSTPTLFLSADLWRYNVEARQCTIQRNLELLKPEDEDIMALRKDWNYLLNDTEDLHLLRRRCENVKSRTLPLGPFLSPVTNSDEVCKTRIEVKHENASCNNILLKLITVVISRAAYNNGRTALLVPLL
jgi:hypothetical protein